MNEDLDMDQLISRRTLLKGAAAVTCVALASAFTGKALAAKSSKSAANYQDKPNGDKKCSNCNLFVPGKTKTADGTCTVVEGSVSPEAYCTLYSRKE
ncbi:MAG: high-potential iron-sulfur protein [Nitrospirota bacterium]